MTHFSGVMGLKSKGGNPMRRGIITRLAFAVIVLDWTGNSTLAQMLYWCGPEGVLRSSLDGSHTELLRPRDFGFPYAFALDLDEQKVYWTGPGIRRSNLDGSGSETLISVAPEASAIILDPAHKRLYWIEGPYSPSSRIRSASFDGSDVLNLISGIDHAYGLALDSDSGRIYWSEAGTHKIRRSFLDGSGIEDFVTSGLIYPESLAIDPASGYLYWTDSGTDKIQRTSLLGGPVETLISTNLGGPDSIVLDLVAEKMYWADWIFDNIRRANLDGSGVETLITENLFDATNIGLDPVHNQIYWSDLTTNRLVRANIDGSEKETVLAAFQPISIAFDSIHRKLYWTYPGDGLGGAPGSIERSNLDASGQEYIHLGAPYGPTRLYINALEGQIYWTSWRIGDCCGDFAGPIRRANLDGSNVTDLFFTLEGAPVDFDFLGAKVYWADYYSIFRSDYFGNDVEYLLNAQFTGALAVDQQNGKIYWAQRETISRANFDGSSIEPVTSRPGAGYPNPIVLDVPRMTLYWVDRIGIRRAGFDGSNIQTIVEDDSGEIFSLALDDRIIGDGNQTGTTDLRDFALFQACFLNPALPADSEICARFDIEPFDGQADLADAAWFVASLTGP